MDEQRLREIEERAKAATEGPWEVDGLGSISRYTEAEYVEVPLGAPPNSAFIAHARQDVPDLLAEVRQLRAERDEARRERDEATRDRTEEARRVDAANRLILDEMRGKRDEALAEVRRLRAELAAKGD